MELNISGDDQARQELGRRGLPVEYWKKGQANPKHLPADAELESGLSREPESDSDRVSARNPTPAPVESPIESLPDDLRNLAKDDATDEIELRGRTNRENLIERALGDLIDASMGPYRLGIDFGTSMSKVQARTIETEQIVDEFYNQSPLCPSAIAFDRETHSVLFGKDAIAAAESNPDAYLLIKSLKRMLIEGRAPGIAEIHPDLTTPKLTVMLMTWLRTFAIHQLLVINPRFAPLNNLTTPVPAQETTVVPFWNEGFRPAKTSLEKMLHYSVIAGAAISDACGKHLPDTVEDWLAQIRAIESHRELLHEAVEKQSGDCTSEPLAALAEHTNLDLGEGIHLLVDSGAGTTDWCIILVLGEHRFVLKQGVEVIGGDTVDQAMFEVFRDACIEEEPSLEAILDDPSINRQALHFLQRDKPLLFEHHYLNFGNQIHGLRDSLDIGSIDIGLAAVLAKCKPRFQGLANRISRHIDQVPQKIADNLTLLQAHGMKGKYDLSHMKNVYWVGGNSQLTVFRESIRDSIHTIFERWDVNPDPIYEPLTIPVSEKAAGRNHPALYAQAAVSIGASKAKLPDSTPIRPDSPPRKWGVDNAMLEN